jgi:TetR/AcrR family transcriptional repressor of nem operon
LTPPTGHNDQVDLFVREFPLRVPAKRKNDPEGLRARILDAAAALFQSRGYGATTTQEIAAAAGVTSGAMHHHFPIKKEIGLAVIRERVAVAVRETWIDPLAHAKTTKKGVAGIFDEICRGLDARGAVQGCPLNNLALELSFGDPDFREELRQVFDEWRQALADRLRADQATGRAAAIDADALAMFVVAAYSGAMALAKADQTSTALRVTADQLKVMLP